MTRGPRHASPRTRIKRGKEGKGAATHVLAELVIVRVLDLRTAHRGLGEHAWIREAGKRRDALCELERNHVPHMHTATTWPTARVQKERLPLLIPIQNFIELAIQTHPHQFSPAYESQQKMASTHRCEKNIPLLSKGCGLCPVNFSNLCKSSSSVRLVPNWRMSLS